MSSLLTVANLGASTEANSLPVPPYLQASPADIAWASSLFAATDAGKPQAAASPAPAASRPAVPADRNAAIDAATLPGTEALAAQLKAYASLSAADAALRIAAHYRSIRDGEGHGGAAAPAGAVRSAVLAGQSVAQNADGWKSEWASSAKLQSEHASAESYANWMQGVAKGCVRIFTGRGAVIRHGESR